MTNDNRQSNQKKYNQDDQYKRSIQPIVDEAMEAHNLAPAIKTAIIENKPLNDELQKVMAEAILRNPEVKEALDKVISENEIIKKSKAVWRQPGFWIPILITSTISIISILVAIFK